ARGGPVLELAIGTGRVALPLAARGVSVSGVDLSPHLVDQLRAKPGAERISLTVGDMTSTRVDGTFKLVYLVWNAIMNVTTQDEQVAVFANAAAHLESGGRFLVEVGVPEPPVPGQIGKVFTMDDQRVGIDTYDDLSRQLMSSHHWIQVNDRFIHHSGQFRYVWPSELDLMAMLAGLRLEHRWAGWRREDFTATSAQQVAVFKKVG
ncbi:MAG TPA: methyltransferase domain-containing protein, partial [Acidimicrobiales bacterium]|nr:methyltransferase domain-containing protein [Acidimicrobiales bacterium]